MTISIEHVMPSELEIEDGSIMGQYRPGNVVTRFETGNFRSRRYFEHNLQSYNLRFTPSKYTDDDLELMMALLERTGMDALPFWVKEPISKSHVKALGEITAASNDTYVLPLDTGTDVVVQAGAAIDFNARTIHAVANLLTDAQANADGGVTTGLTTYGSCAISSVRYPALAGRSSILIDPSGAQTNVGVELASTARAAIAGDGTYTVGASFFVEDAADTYYVTGQFYDGASPSGSPFSDSDTGTVGQWLHLRATATAGSSDDELLVRAYRSDSSSANFHVGCLMVAPGTLERWFMPSMAPRAIEWTATAPADDLRLIFSAPDCPRWTRLVLARNQQGAVVELEGDSKQDVMRVNEVIYRKGQ